MGYNIVSAEEINSSETGLGIGFTAPAGKVFSDHIFQCEYSDDWKKEVINLFSA